MAVPELARTVDGFEEQFGVNYLAHYVLTALLLPTLIKSSTPSFNSRVIPVTSSGHGFSSVNFDDINFSKGYHPWVAYGQSKTGLIWLSNYIDRVYGSHGVHANAVHPGAILTPLLKHIPADQTEAWSQDQSFMNQAKSPEQGAATTVWAAVASVWEGQGGHYLSDCGVGKKAIDPSKMEDEGFASHAFDVEGEDKLWKLSAELAGIKVEV
jgi:NAD(P)-dependent dehydrogenase (short-subunit alcohol dehydrogenase family)